ncbi:hypothetical protein CAPTEDRAFT_163321 [Capitella teleta]|uniref:Membrane metallo-endopeptidase-like 1 n=1 Tax=Capitella teleta TaxID=283909 RepID=R7UQB9_CAPTE|nr:hypothetical protein CAPTEDRAFT_163321 [Capitella teleta]|eukprot:ELU08395.1 hypothetical protein CAPTEDRAFT_163321 [Capitella teleta]
MDKTADPCEDFFQYACGEWNRIHIIPEDKSSYNTFEKLHDELQVKLKGLLEESSPKPYDTESTLKAKVLYQSCIDTNIIEVVGDKPVHAILKDMGGWPVLDPSWSTDQDWQFEKLLGKLRKVYNAPILLESWVAPDDKNSSVYIVQLDQPTLGMPSREYYLKDMDLEYKQAYFKYMTQIATLLGAESDEAARQMQLVLDFEIALANITTPQIERHDTGAMYQKLSLRELRNKVPQFDWMTYFKTYLPVNVTEDEEVVSMAMEYIHKLGNLIVATDKKTLTNYCLWRLLLGLSPEMTEKFQKQRGEYLRVLQGVSRDKVRWQKCIEYVNERMGMAVGKLFIKDYFRKESKDTALEMIHNLREAFNEILMESDWMDDETKAVAMEKANAMNERIGYPEFILNATELDKIYAGLQFNSSAYFENVLKVEAHGAYQNLKQLRETVKKDQWHQDPAVVNAFYNPNMNDIVFPAGILQPLFYSAEFPKSLNYGGIGVVIGHEITHGFDDKGRQYNKEGNLRQWWNNETIERFREQAQCTIDQYSKYTLEPFGYSINGRNTQGENIADNGGLKESYRAYQKWVKRNGEEQPLPGIDLNHNQLFFLNYAQIWCGIMRDEEALHKIRTSVHSPGPIRVLGPLSNSHEFAEVYQCRSGSRMNPVHKCSLW